jgi:hypothetical protein
MMNPGDETTMNVPVLDSATESDRSTGAEVGDEVLLRIADQTLRFRAASPEVRLFLHDNHLPFRVPSDTRADCDIRWDIGEVRPSPVPVVRQFDTRWEIRMLADGSEEITFFNATGDDPTFRPTMQMVSNPEFTSLQVRQAPRGEPLAYVSEYPWAEYIIQRRLGLYGGAILHASMAIWDGVGHVFLGHSGAGKSTIAELAEGMGATIPTDDRTIVTVGPGGIMGWGTPWHGSFRRTSAQGAPIGSISLLVQDSADRLEPIDPGRALKEMFVRTVQARVTEREVHSTLDTLESVATGVPFFELRFRPTPAVIELVLREAGRRNGGSTGRDVSAPQGLAPR